MPSLGIIIVDFNNPRDSAECIESLLHSEFRDFEIILVDNGSAREVKLDLGRRFPDVIFLRSDINLGFAGGTNLGIRRALADSCDTVLLLNNDTVVPPHMLGTLLHEMQKRQADIVCPKILYHDPPHRVWFGGGSYNQTTAKPTHLGIGELDDGRWDQAIQCDFVSGCALLTRRAVLEEIGLLDESFFAYYEDSDFCTRARLKRRTVWYIPSATLYHKVSRTAQWDSPIYQYLNARNRLLMVRRYAGSRMVVGCFFFISYVGRQFARLAIKYRDANGVRALLWGVWDGVRKFSGEHGEGRLPLILQMLSQRPHNRPTA